jgi:hypothetical protein
MNCPNCTETQMCDGCFTAAMLEHAWLANVPRGAVTGVMSEAEKQALRDAGRGHLVRP